MELLILFVAILLLVDPEESEILVDVNELLEDLQTAADKVCFPFKVCWGKLTRSPECFL